MNCTYHKVGLTVSLSSQSLWSAVLFHLLKVPLRSALAPWQATLAMDFLCTPACRPAFPGMRPSPLHLTWDLAVPAPTASSQVNAAHLPTPATSGPPVAFESSFPTPLSRILSDSSLLCLLFLRANPTVLFQTPVISLTNLHSPSLHSWRIFVPYSQTSSPPTCLSSSPKTQNIERWALQLIPLLIPNLVPVSVCVAGFSMAISTQLIRFLQAAFPELELTSNLPHHAFSDFPLMSLRPEAAATLPPKPQLCTLKAKSQILT